MNHQHESVVLSANSAPLHCQHRSASGRRFCRMAVADPASSLCARHAAEQKRDRDAANVASRLIGDTEQFTSAVAINRSLGELYKLLARDEIPPRRAAVMAYTASLLLRCLPAIEHETAPASESEPPRIIIDMPRPDRGDLVDPERAMYAGMAGRCGPAHANTDIDSESSTISGAVVSPVESPK